MSCRWWDSKLQPLDYTPSALAIELYSSIKLLLGRSRVYPVGELHHYIFIISQLWLTSHPRSTVVLLDTGTPGTSREILQWGYRWWDSNLQPLDYKPSALAIELYSSIKLLQGRSWVYPVGELHHYIFIISQLWLTSHPRSTVDELFLSSWWIASLYIYHFSTVIDFSSKKYSGWAVFTCWISFTGPLHLWWHKVKKHKTVMLHWYQYNATGQSLITIIRLCLTLRQITLIICW